MLTEAASENIDHYMRMGEQVIANHLDDKRVSRFTPLRGDPDETESLIVGAFLASCDATGKAMQELLQWLRDRQDNRPVMVSSPRRRSRVARGGRRRIP